MNIQWFQLGLTLPYFKVDSKITRDFAAQCSLFTYKHVGIFNVLLNQLYNYI